MVQGMCNLDPAIKCVKCTFATFSKNSFAHLLIRYLDSQYVTADESVLSFLNLTQVFLHTILDNLSKISCFDHSETKIFKMRAIQTLISQN